MIYRTLGQSGLKVSALTLGTMMFGEQTNTEDSLRIIDKAWDQGINFIDTADVYTGGRSEEIVGEAIGRHRADWVVASKVGFGPPDGLPNRSGLNRKRIFNALEASLTRLDTDYLDIYYLHREDHDTPLDVTISAIGDLIRQGKIRYWGLSNYRGWRIAEVVRVAERLGSTGRSSASRCTTSSTARPRWSRSPRPQPMAWAWCLTARWPVVCSVASTRRISPPSG